MKVAAQAGARAGATLGVNEAAKSGATAGAMAGAAAGQKAGAEAGAVAAAEAATEVATKTLKEALANISAFNKPVGIHLVNFLPFGQYWKSLKFLKQSTLVTADTLGTSFGVRNCESPLYRVPFPVKPLLPGI